MLFYCWASVADGWPTSNKHCLNVPCSARIVRLWPPSQANPGGRDGVCLMLGQRRRQWASINPAPCQYPAFSWWFSDFRHAPTCRTIIGLILAHSLQGWPNINPTLCQRIVIARCVRR